MVEFNFFDIFKASEADWAKFYKFRRLVNAELEPDQPLMADEAYKYYEQGFSKAHLMKMFYYNIFLNGAQIGYLYFDYYDEKAPSYKGNEKLVYFDIKILKKHHQQGIGTQALKILVEKCSQANRSLFVNECCLPEGDAFNKAIGSTLAQVHNENKLIISEIDKLLIKNWIQEGKNRNPETKVKIFENRIPDAYIVEYSKSFTEAGNNEPRDGVKKGDEVFSVEIIRKEEEKDANAGCEVYICVSIEKDGQISSFTQLKRFPGREQTLSQGLTGVPEKFKGRKLAKLVKAMMLEFILQKHPDTKEIITGNAKSNGPMLHINTALGYRKFKEYHSYQVSLEQLSHYLSKRNISPLLNTT